MWIGCSAVTLLSRTLREFPSATGASTQRRLEDHISLIVDGTSAPGFQLALDFCAFSSRRVVVSFRIAEISIILGPKSEAVRSLR
jgi:hypothetical protein